MMKEITRRDPLKTGAVVATTAVLGMAGSALPLSQAVADDGEIIMAKSELNAKFAELAEKKSKSYSGVAAICYLTARLDVVTSGGQSFTVTGY